MIARRDRFLNLHCENATHAKRKIDISLSYRAREPFAYVLVGEASGNMIEKSRLASETIRVRLHLRAVRRTVSEINQFTERRERERERARRIIAEAEYRYSTEPAPARLQRFISRIVDCPAKRQDKKTERQQLRARALAAFAGERDASD